MKNTVQIKLTLSKVGLNGFRVIPTFKNLLHNNQISILREGENILTVNHTVWGAIQRVVNYDPANMFVEKI